MRFVMLALFLILNLHAEEFVIQGGQSPDARYAILLVRDAKPPDPEIGLADYRVVFRNNRTQIAQPLKTGSNGFCNFEGAQQPVNSQAWWSPDGRFVALCFRTTKHSREPYLYQISRGTIHRVSLPDYDAIIYGRLGVEKFNGRYVRCPTGWSDSHILELMAWGDMNECHITLRIRSRGAGAAKVSIVKVTKGQSLEG